MVAGAAARGVARRTAQQPSFMQMGGPKHQPWGDEPGCSGREYHAAELTFSLAQPQQQQQQQRAAWLLHGSVSREQPSPAQSSPGSLPWTPLLQTLQRSAMAAISLQAGTLIIPAIAASEPRLATSQDPQAAAAAARRAVGSHSGAQLWLQEQLSRVPFFRPLAQQLSATSAIPAAGLLPGADGAAVLASPGDAPVVKRKALVPPKHMTPQDQQLWDMFVEMDANGDGEICESELLMALNKLGLPCSPSYVDQMMRQFQTPSSTTTTTTATTTTTTAIATTTSDTGSVLSATATTATATAVATTVGKARGRGRGRGKAKEAEGQGGSSTSGAAAAPAGQSDENGASGIAWEDFRRYVLKREDQIYAAFKEFDRDDNGVVTAWEIGQVLVKAGLPTTGRDIRKVMEVLGKDVTDTISYQEFRKFACFMPSWQVKNMEVHSYAGWLFTAPTVSSAASRRRPNIISDPLQHFMAFDLLMRTCMAGSLALMVVMAIKLD